MSKSDKIIWGESVYPYDRADITMQTFTVKDSDVYGVAELDSHGYNNLYI